MSRDGATVLDDPGAGFWLRCVEAEGALSEDQGDHAVVVLPPAVRERFALDEIVTVTADPEVARDDGALLLLPGQPVLDGAASAVVDEGDAGVAWLPWPERRVPAASQLLERAREALAVEHGRLDADGEAARVWLPVLRVGAVATTSASLDLRFQERHEVWVDARTGFELPDQLFEHVTGATWTAPAPQRHAVLSPDLPRSLRAADRLLRDRADRRAEALTAQAAEDRREALERVAAYYDKALETIRRRRQAADEDERRELLDAQAEATRLEQQRRSQEVEDAHRLRVELAPFRLHLVMVPALRLPLVVRRGSTTFPFELVWELESRGFVPVACPHCGRGEALVAGRKRLGCAGCLPRPVHGPEQDVGPATCAETPAAAPGSAEAEAPAGEPPPAGGPADTTSPGSGTATSTSERGRKAAARPPQGSAAARAPRTSAAARAPRRSADRGASVSAAGRLSPERIREVGERLVLRFWEEVLHRRRWHRRRVPDGTPLAALHRLYGRDAPLVVVGMPAGELPESVQAYTTPQEAGRPAVTHGDLRSRDGSVYRFALWWEPRTAGPQLLELLPGLLRREGRLPQRWSLGHAVAARLYEHPPRPKGLDPVGQALWRVDLPRGGLPLVVRCLTAWWRIADEQADLGAPPGVLAAALASLVENRSGLRRSRAEAAADHGVAADEVTDAATRLQRRLELTSQRPW